MSRCMEPGHAFRQVEGVVSSCMRMRHAASHVEHEVSPRMRPEPCEATHGLPHGLFLIAHDPLSFEHVQNTSKSVQSVREREQRKKDRVSIVFERFKQFSRTITLPILSQHLENVLLKLDVGLLEMVRKGSDRRSQVWGQGHSQPKTVPVTWKLDHGRRPDEATMICNFMYGLKPELGSRLAGSNFISLSDLVEKAVNVETVLEAERKTIPHSGGHTKFSHGERPNFNKGPRSKKGKGQRFGGQTNYRSNTGVCYIFDQPGHISKVCPNRQRSNQQVSPSLRMEYVTCFFCGRN
ncbi:hypothetical protein IGI04_023234, partial [Brassica rapa subsp. trilocularis]